MDGRVAFVRGKNSLVTHRQAWPMHDPKYGLELPTALDWVDCYTLVPRAAAAVEKLVTPGVSVNLSFLLEVCEAAAHS